QHRRRHQRARERAPPGLVRAGDELDSERAVVSQQSMTGPEELAHWALTDGDGHIGERSATIPCRRGRVADPSHLARVRLELVSKVARRSEVSNRLRSAGRTLLMKLLAGGRPKGRPAATQTRSNRRATPGALRERIPALEK